ncbi:MAG: flagellar hook assembly protein FlgD [Alphaproteobacteria bacterium]|nr:flagellar hook assembly protein FlgD [Alphaproteobacteria bacterium]
MTTTATGIQTLSNAVSNGTDSSSSKTKLFDDMQAFLYLLTQQLQYQDPLDPMDTAEYTNQLVQYAEVEQSIQQNSYLETIINQNINAMSAQSVNYMDKTVQALSDKVPLQDGYAKFAYVLEDDAQNCTVTITDASGNYVKSINTETTSGRHELSWDGKDNNGNQLPDGAYKIIVTASNHSGETVGVKKYAYGKVTGVAYDGADVAVAMGDVAVDMNSVVAIHPNSILDHGNSQQRAATDEILDKVEEISQNVAQFVNQYNTNLDNKTSGTADAAV